MQGIYLISFNSIVYMVSENKQTNKQNGKWGFSSCCFGSVFILFYSSRLPIKVAVTNWVAVKEIVSPSWMEIRCGMTLDDSKLTPILWANRALEARLCICQNLFVMPLFYSISHKIYIWLFCCAILWWLYMVIQVSLLAENKCVENNVCTPVTNCFSTHQRVILVFVSRVAK